MGGKENYASKKILWYFSLASRIQRLFISSHTTKHMSWHKTRDIGPGQLTYPVDRDEWKKFNENFPQLLRRFRMSGLA